jgi:hypothetical protein
MNNSEKMEENLISKKELLDLTGISYGQLYRWKRKQLIPEDWFIKKSSFTGQETFFPKEKILGRVDKIINMKDDHSLDDIADRVSTAPVNFSLSKDELIAKNLVSLNTINFYTQHKGDPEIFSFDRILFLYILDKKFLSGEMSLDEGLIVLDALEENYQKFDGKDTELILIRKLGVSSCLLAQVPNKLYFEKNTKLLFRINISSYIEEIK